MKITLASILLTLTATAQAEIILDVDTQAQIMYVYNDEELLEVMEISSGREGKETPVGEFEILQKKVKHRSSIYGSSMPYMQRLTWTGIAIHEGDISTSYASHGCIRVSRENAEKLYSLTRLGTRVYVR